MDNLWSFAIVPAAGMLILFGMYLMFGTPPGGWKENDTD